MANLPTDRSEGPIRISLIRKEFGGDNPDAISEYYKGGKYVGSGVAAGIPTTGEIKWSDFYGAVDINPNPGTKTFDAPGLIEFEVPSYDVSMTIEVYGAGGSSGESTYDGTIVGNNQGDAQGFDGVAGQLTTIVGPSGSITIAAVVSKPSSVGPFSYIPDPTVAGAIATGGGGGGGGGWKGYAYKGQPVGADGTDGAPGEASVAAQSDDDAVTTGGGSAGGPKTGYVGMSWNKGGTGGAGGYAKKVYLADEDGAPIAGTRLKGYVGKGGEIPRHWGGASIGGNGKIVITWS